MLLSVWAHAYAGGATRGAHFNEGVLEMSDYPILFDEADDDPGIPLSDEIQLYAKDKAGTTTLYTQDASGTVQELGSPDLSAYLTSSDAALTYQTIGAYLTDAPSDGSQYLRLNGNWSVVTIPAGTINRTITFTFDGNYASPTVATTASCVMGYDGAFTGWKIINEAGTNASIVLTIKKNGSIISGTEKPTLSTQSTNSDTALGTWTTAFAKGDIIQAYVTSASTGIRYVCSLYAEATT